MGPLFALALATPIFGLALTPPSLPAQLVAVSPRLLLQAVAPYGKELQGEEGAAEAGELSKEGSGDKARARKKKSNARKRREEARARKKKSDARKRREEARARKKKSDARKRREKAEARKKKPDARKQRDEEVARQQRDKGSVPGWGASADSWSDSEGDEPAAQQDDFTLQLRHRADLAKVHRTLGILTWGATTLALASGIVQFRNLYGASTLAGTPCVTGDAWPSQNRCTGAPVGHLATGVIAGGLYTATFTLAAVMPDPDNAAEGDSKFAKRLRAHKILRWVHLVGMVAQVVLGPLIANPHLIGKDRANDYRSLAALSTAHLAVGAVTWAALTSAGALMLF